jgi:hypothetical protein
MVMVMAELCPDRPMGERGSMLRGRGWHPARCVVPGGLRRASGTYGAGGGPGRPAVLQQVLASGRNPQRVTDSRCSQNHAQAPRRTHARLIRFMRLSQRTQTASSSAQESLR